MAFTVTRSGATDAEFVEYARMYRQQGKSLASVPRVPDPEDPQRSRSATIAPPTPTPTHLASVAGPPSGWKA